MSQQTVLIVDDEPDIRELLEITLTRMGLNTLSAADLAEAHERLANHTVDLCLTDMKLPDGNGMHLVEHIQQHHNQLPVAMITAHGNVDTAIKALKTGAFDFISKPIELERLRNLVNTALKIDTGRQGLSVSSQTLVGETDSIEELRGQIAKLARSQAPIYVSGESGSGKEIVARLIHSNGPRNSGPFIPVNCGAIPPELMESELFGHLKGSFTGAQDNKEGLFQAAQGGTLFLDEVADLPLAMQVKLLRAIQEKAVRPVGASDEVPVDVRIVSATHKDLELEVQEGRFRNDLYYRINVIGVRVPSLRERVKDIPLLAAFFLQRWSDPDSGTPLQLGESAYEALASYSFPGNVRELENILERACTLCSGERIEAEDLHLPQAANTISSAGGDRGAGFGDLEGYLESIEKGAIAEALEETGGNKTEAAKLLGISFRSMRYRLKKLNLDD